MQKDMLKEIDNYAVLKSYGIEIVPTSQNTLGGPERSANRLNINGSGDRIYEEEHKRV